MARDSATVYRITVGDGRSTEALVEAGNYGYAHSAVISENFPAAAGPKRAREIALLAFDRDVSAREVADEAARLDLAAPTWEDALAFGIEHPDVQRTGPVVFLHEPWVGYFGRRDVLMLWENAGRRELGLAAFDEPFGRDHRFAFVRR
jgi:hypothetical protein